MKKYSYTIIVFLTLFASTSMPAPAHAQVAAGAAACAVGSYLSSMIAGSLQSMMSSEVPVGGKELNKTDQKQFILDHLASCAAKAILHQMTLSTINWINSGFNGSPAFLTNPEGFFLDAADQITGQYLSDGGPLQNLCSPWKVDVRLALALNQSSYNAGGAGSGRYTCTLSKVIKNAKNTSFSIDGFTKGDFSQGGWPAFISMVTVPQNNPYGAYLTADSDLLAAIGVKQGGIAKSITDGQGFLSWQSCKTVNLSDPSTPMQIGPDGTASTVSVSSGGGMTQQQCETQTPGSVIAHSLNVHTDSGVVEAELANDINSVVNALITQLTSQMLSKGLHALSGGGSGVSGSGYSNADSYISQLQKDTTSGQTAGTYSNAVNLVMVSKAAFATASACFNTKITAATSKGGTPATTAPMQTNINSINLEVTNDVDPLLSMLNTKLTNVQNGSTAITNTMAQADMTNAQTQAQSFNFDAAAFQNTCDALP